MLIIYNTFAQTRWIDRNTDWLHVGRRQSVAYNASSALIEGILVMVGENRPQRPHSVALFTRDPMLCRISYPFGPVTQYSTSRQWCCTRRDRRASRATCWHPARPQPPRREGGKGLRQYECTGWNIGFGEDAHREHSAPKTKREDVIGDALIKYEGSLRHSVR